MEVAAALRTVAERTGSLSPNLSIWITEWGLNMDAISGPHGQRQCVHFPFRPPLRQLDLTDTKQKDPSEATANRHVHGSIPFSMMDTLSAFHILGVTGEYGHASIDVSLQYVAPMPAGVEYILTSEIVKTGRNFVFLEMNVVDQETLSVCFVRGRVTKARKLANKL